MAAFKNLSAWVSEVEKRNRKAGYRAMNKSVAKTRTEFRKRMQKEIGLKAKDINSRFYTRKASSKSLVAYVSLGTKVGIPLRLFKPKEKIVKIGRGKNARRYVGVTVKIPSEGGRFVVPKGFMIKTSRGKALSTPLVAMRKTAARKPLVEVRYDVKKTADQHQASLVKFMKSDFKTQFKAQLKVVK